MPDGDGSVAGVVVAHPHPQHGGSMHNNVVVALCEGLHNAGIASLRFNFRGVGQSQGTYSGGADERLDVLGALAYLEEQPQIAPGRIGLAGYSFGARVSLAVVSDARQIGALLCVAPPLQEPLPAEQTPACPFLVLVGDHDRAAAQGLDRYASYLPGPECLQVVRGTDHFWQGFEPVLVEVAGRFFADALHVPGAGILST